jgi:hypothetical protein
MASEDDYWEDKLTEDHFKLKTLKQTDFEELSTDKQREMKHTCYIELIKFCSTKEGDDLEMHVHMLLQAIDKASIKDVLSEIRKDPPVGRAFINLNYVLSRIETFDRDGERPSSVFIYKHLFQFVDYLLQIYFKFKTNYKAMNKTVLHLIFIALRNFDLQFNPKLMRRLYLSNSEFVEELHLEDLKPRKRIEFDMILSVHAATIRNFAFMLDDNHNTTYGKNWHLKDYIGNEIKKSFDQDYTRTLVKEDKAYFDIQFERFQAYRQLVQKPPLLPIYLAKAMHQDGILIQTAALQTDAFQVQNKSPADKLVNNNILQNLQSLNNDNVGNYNNLAEDFVNHFIVTYCSTIYSSKERSILKRMVEIISFYSKLDLTLFLHAIGSAFTSLQSSIYNGNGQFKTDIIRSIQDAFTKLYTILRQGAGPRVGPASGGASDDDIDSVDTDNTKDTQRGGDDINTKDFVMNSSRQHAINRFKSSQGDNDKTDGIDVPYTPIKLIKNEQDKIDTEIINAAKRNAQHEYYKTIANYAAKGGDSSTTSGISTAEFSPEYIAAEETLRGVRGNLMKKYIASHSLKNPALEEATEDKITDMTLELVVCEYNTKDARFEPLHKNPIKSHYAKPDKIDIFNPNPTSETLNEIIETLAQCDINTSWNTERQEKQQDGSTEIKDDSIEIKKHIIPNEILNAIRSVVANQSKNLKIDQRTNTMKLSAFFTSWDNTARTGILDMDLTRFQYNDKPASFSISLNTTNFTRTEGYQNRLYLKKANLDLENFLRSKHSMYNFLDLKVRVITPTDKQVELTWSIHKYLPDNFQLTHLAYISENPNQTLLTLPVKESAVHLDERDYIPKTVCVNHTHIKAEKLNRADEITLMKIHEQGVHGCLSTGIQDIAGESYKEAIGFIYYYHFWTLIGSCFQIHDYSNQKYLTCYTVVHRSSEFAKPLAYGQREMNNTYSFPSQAHPPVYISPTRQPQYTPVYQYLPHSMPQVPHYRQNFAHGRGGVYRTTYSSREKVLPRGNDWFIFGLVDENNAEQYGFIKCGNHDERVLYQKCAGKFQYNVYTRFYPQTVSDSSEVAGGLPIHIKQLLDEQNPRITISHIPGMFCQWMKLHPNGIPPSENPESQQYPTAMKYWTHLWDEFAEEQGITIEKHKMPLTREGYDDKLRAYDKLYERHEDARSTSSRGSSRGRGRGRGGGRGGFKSSHFHYDHDHVTIGEDSTETVLQMQHEINTLRRSLNQLALLQS